MTKDVNPWELIHDKAISQLVFAYEAVLTEMRTHARADRTIKEWVKRLDFERDEFVKSMLVKPDEPEAKFTPHAMAVDGWQTLDGKPVHCPTCQCAELEKAGFIEPKAQCVCGNPGCASPRPVDLL